MGLFDRFTSTKGKDQTTGPKRGVVKKSPAKKTKAEADKEAFASVGAAAETKVTKKEKAETATSMVRQASAASHTIQRTLLRPIVTEKSTRGGAQSQYTFEVATSATKADIRQSVRHLYGVMPVAVNIINRRANVVRFGRTYGKTAATKKAIVTLPAGKTIDVVSA